MSTARLETFADGVFAIAATLLILDVHTSGSNLGHDLVRIWPSYDLLRFEGSGPEALVRPA